jgi:hypothetical protein
MISRRPALFFLLVALALRIESLLGPYSFAQVHDTLDNWLVALKVTGAQLIRHGIFGWDPSIVCGFVSPANGFLPYNPLALLSAVFPVWFIWSLLAFSMSFLSGWGMYLLLYKCRRLTPAASVFGGVLFTLYLLANAYNVGAIWIHLFPLYLYLFDLCQQPGVRQRLIGFLGMFVLFLATGLQDTVPFFPFVHLMMILAGLESPSARRDSLALFGLVWTCFSLLHAPSLYVALSEATYSVRAEVAQASLTSTVTDVLRSVIGRIWTPNLVLYIVPMALIVVAMRFVHDRWIKFWAAYFVLVEVALLLNASRVGIYFHDHLGPLRTLSMFRWEQVFPFSFCVLAADGFGALAGERSSSKTRWFLGTVLTLIAIVVAHSVVDPAKIYRIKLLLLVAIPLLILALIWYSGRSPSGIGRGVRKWSTGALLVYLACIFKIEYFPRFQARGPIHFYFENPAVDAVQRRESSDGEPRSLYRVARVGTSHPSYFSYHLLQTAEGYVNIYPLRYKRFWEKVIEPLRTRSPFWWDYFTGGGLRVYLFTTSPIHLPAMESYREMEFNPNLLALASVKYIFSQHPIENPSRYDLRLFRPPTPEEMRGLERVDQLMDTVQSLKRTHSLAWAAKLPRQLAAVWFGTCRPYWVYEVTRVLPRAQLVPQWEMFAKPEELLAALGKAENPELAQKAFLLSADVPHPSQLPKSTASSFKGFCRITRYSPDHITIEGKADAECLLVVHDNYDRHWQARVNGRTTPLFPADYTFRGILIPPGPFEAELAYVNKPLRWMYGLSLAGGMGLLGLGLARRPRAG